MVIRGLGVKRAIAGPEANRRKGVSCFRMKMYETETPQHSAATRGKTRERKASECCHRVVLARPTALFGEFPDE